MNKSLLSIIAVMLLGIGFVSANYPPDTLTNASNFVGDFTIGHGVSQGTLWGSGTSDVGFKIQVNDSYRIQLANVTGASCSIPSGSFRITYENGTEISSQGDDDFNLNNPDLVLEGGRIYRLERTDTTGCRYGTGTMPIQNQYFTWLSSSINGADYDTTSFPMIESFGIKVYEPFTNTPPSIISRNPTINPNLTQGDIQSFSVSVTDPDNQTLTYTWLLDSVNQSNNQATFDLNTSSLLGSYSLELVVDDGEANDSTSWSVVVNEAPTGYQGTYESDDISTISVDFVARAGITIVSFATVIGLLLFANYTRKKLE